MSFIDFIFSPLLKIDAFYSIIIISLLVSIFVTLIYKLMTDQVKMKHLKKKLKHYQAEMKALRKEPEKMMKVQQQSMKVNMEYMKLSMKPTLITFIPIMIIFWWLKANLAFLPILPYEPFEVTAIVDIDFIGEVTLNLIKGQEGIIFLNNQTKTPMNNELTWSLQGDPGIYVLEFKTDNELKQKKLIIATDNYEAPEEIYKSSNLKKVIIKNEPIHPIRNIPLLNQIPWIKDFKWLGTYIIFSLIFGMSFRKLLKLH